VRKKKISASVKQQLIELKINRNQIDGFLGNFLVNYSIYAKTMHNQLPATSLNDDLKTHCYQYLSSIISCWETFFRDVFVFLVSIDTELKSNTINKLQLKSIEVDNIESKVEWSDYLSKCFNFQNFNDTKEALFPVFNMDIFEKTAQHEFMTFLPNKNKSASFSINSCMPDYYKTLLLAMELRHVMVHDANFIRKAPLDLALFRDIETLFLIFPQVLAKLLADKYNIPSYYLKKEDKYYKYLFMVEDLINDDWIVLEK
jgi:hypothetical protein